MAPSRPGFNQDLSRKKNRMVTVVIQCYGRGMLFKHATTTTVKTSNKKSLTTAYISKPELAKIFEGTCLNCL